MRATDAGREHPRAPELGGNLLHERLHERDCISGDCFDHALVEDALAHGFVGIGGC